jgi:NADH:ubiquinone oxidoreductase subunit 3 (subunit A)
MCRSTCFGPLHAHHQEHTTALTTFGFTLERGGSSVVGRGLDSYNRLDHNQQRFYPQCSCKLLIMGVESPETCWAAHKRQVIHLWNCYILLVNLFVLYDGARTCQRQTFMLYLWNSHIPKIVHFFMYILRIMLGILLITFLWFWKKSILTVHCALGDLIVN